MATEMEAALFKSLSIVTSMFATTLEGHGIGSLPIYSKALRTMAREQDDVMTRDMLEAMAAGLAGNEPPSLSVIEGGRSDPS